MPDPCWQHQPKKKGPDPHRTCESDPMKQKAPNAPLLLCSYGKGQVTILSVAMNLHLLIIVTAGVLAVISLIKAAWQPVLLSVAVLLIAIALLMAGRV